MLLCSKVSSVIGVRMISCFCKQLEKQIVLLVLAHDQDGARYWDGERYGRACVFHRRPSIKSDFHFQQVGLFGDS